VIRVEGKDVLTELHELADPRHAALGGCTTEGCVESTARDAMFCDHYVVIAEDGSYHVGQALGPNGRDVML
jgi:nicotinamidase-related amidase